MTVIRSRKNAFSYLERLRMGRDNEEHIISCRTHESEIGIFERLEQHPASLSDEDLRILMATHEHSRGRNAHIPAMCFLILEARRSPTRKAKHD